MSLRLLLTKLVYFNDDSGKTKLFLNKVEWSKKKDGKKVNRLYKACRFRFIKIFKQTLYDHMAQLASFRVCSINLCGLTWNKNSLYDALRCTK